ncbi:sodium/calcium exchanger regulatory protein 1-like [Patiria miniata]|uniref:Cytosolic fatty-acid binding proteins domain-containing protein n=1 Tax=Patiria miniata TaxID=46514 RepID=A0A914BIG9_PATMI|nr:sodium/calcium exchanger regulatory protein 1-like [Patiria miniata]
MAGETTAPAVDLSGKWQLDRNENFDEFLKAAGFAWITRKLINSVTTVLEIGQDGDRFTISTNTPVGVRVTSFTLGRAYPETNPMFGDGEHRVLAEWEGAKLVQRVVPDTASIGDVDEVPRTFEREIVNGELVVTIRRGDVATKRYFKKL